MELADPEMQRAVVRLVLDRERTLDGLERMLGSGAVAAVKVLAADGVVLRHGERLGLPLPVAARRTRTPPGFAFGFAYWYALGVPDRSRRRPRDPNQLGKLIVDIATGEVADASPDDGKDPAAVALGRRGGLKGGRARAAKLTAAERSEAARRAAEARWKRRV